jgi:hypothetical protein
MITPICVTLDFYNSSFSIRNNTISHLWNDPASFVTDTGFPFSDSVGLLSYEPDRNIFLIERPGGLTDSGLDLQEMQWIQNNLTTLTEVTATRMAENTFIFTMEMKRVGLLVESDWVFQRHQEEELLGLPKTFSQEKLIEVLEYRQQLRDLANTYTTSTPADDVIWPASPL